MEECQDIQVTRLVQKGTGKTTLAIGDGENDVGRLQEADISVGISGIEGMQDAVSSDLAIAQFRFLERLLLVHGHWCYRRIYMMNIAFGFTLSWFEALASFSGQPAYNDCDRSRCFRARHLCSTLSEASHSIPRGGPCPQLDLQRHPNLHDHFLLYYKISPSPSLPRRRARGRLRGPRCHDVHLRCLDNQLPDGAVDKLLHLDPALFHIGKHRFLVRVFGDVRLRFACGLDDGLPRFW